MASALSPIERLEAACCGSSLPCPSAPSEYWEVPGRVTIDGQVLDPEAQLLLRLLRAHRRPAHETLPVAEARIEDPARSRCRIRSATAGRERRRADAAHPGGNLNTRLYVPFEAATPGPLLVYLHGGGWVVGDLDTHDQTCRFIAREAGVRVLAVDYRRAPEHPFPAPWTMR